MRTFVFCAAVAAVIAASDPAASLRAADREAQWQNVDEAMRQGLPQTAIEELQPIITAALADEAYPEAIKAIGRRIALEGNIQGNKPEEKIVRLQAELANAPAAMQPAMEALLAHWYWHYFQQNRWRFIQRTQAGEAAGEDLQTWDLARILTEIDTHFTAALADEAGLKATSVSEYDELLEPGSVPDAYRPTLFDFLVHEALQFYQAGEQGAMQAEDEFVVDAVASPIFAGADEFLQWQPPAVDGYSPTLRAVRLYQSLLTFHRRDADRSAFYDADLARLAFGRNVAVGEEKDARHQAALERFIAATSRHEVSARASAALAEAVNAAGDPAQARALAQRGLRAFPDSTGGAMCFNLIQQIEAKSARLETERVWNAPWPTLDVTYRNVAKVYFRAVAWDFDHYVRRSRWGFGYVNDEQRERLLAAAPTHSWDADLPPTADFKERTERLPAPSSLRPGFYFILASHEPEFGTADNQLSVAAVWVSELALVLQLRGDGATHRGFVLQAASGEPVPGATVQFWRRDREGWFRPATPTTADENGSFEFEAKDREVVVLARQGEQEVSTSRPIQYHGYEMQHADTHTVFFTDRALYRPGQAIHYKGVSMRYDQKRSRYAAIDGLGLTVVFNDPNGKEIARATHQTNDYGSFHGVFTAPRDRLMGRMTIAVPGHESETAINVEEYKRPKFQVELAAPVQAAKLTAPVDVTGRATAYTGAAIGGAKVKWRVERSVQLPYWCWWWEPPATKAIAHGTAVTAPDGTFDMRFVAAPDRSVPEKNEPTFTFTIHADVTDSNGETRSDSRIVRAGYTALAASIAAAAWQTPQQPVAFTVETRSLDGDPQAARGTVKIHALEQPARVARAPLRRQRFWWMQRETDPPVDPSNPDSWEPGRVVAEQAFAADAGGDARFALALPAGIYRAELETRDRFGRRVTARCTVRVIDPAQRHFGIKVPNAFVAPDWSLEPGGTFTALWGTGYDTGRAFVEVECAGRNLQRFWTPASRTQAVVTQLVTEAMRGGFTLRVTFVRENRVYVSERVVQVPWSNKQLSVKWERFRSKLMPGEQETWTAIVTGPEAQRASAEMVAALYDASLDQFLPHAWPQTFPFFRSEYGRVHTDFQNSALDFMSFAHDWGQEFRVVDWSYRRFPDDLTENLWRYSYPSAPMFAARGGSEEMVVLSPFEVASAGPAVGYMAADTIAGSRMDTAMLDIAADTVPGAESPPKPDLSKVSARRNLSETAFFFPRLIAGDDGVVKIEFTMPEALTEWKFLGFAHDQELRAGLLTDTVVTAKDLMVEPNPPRFVREGDAIEFVVKVSNQTDQAQRGTVRLTLADAVTLAPVDEALGNRQPERDFEVPAKQSRSYAWRLAVPDGLGFVTYKAVGATLDVSDGEEGVLPVLSRRILVRESLPLPIRGPAERDFKFTKLLDSGSSSTLRHQSLTVQMVSQPAWYAVMALPYLMEYPHQCSEQVFNRLYANALARHIASSDPKIRRIFDLWKATPALDSPLQKNEDLKAVMLEETPWLREAMQESESRRNVGLLFDANRLDVETAATLRTLAERQLSDGLWSWFPGGRPSEYISLYITTGFGRLRHLGVAIEIDPAVKALAALDAWMADRYRRIPNRENYVPSYLDALYLYGRSFFLQDQAVAAPHREAVEFYLRQARRFWLRLDSRQSQAHLAIALQRFDDRETAQAIMQSLLERSVRDEELGRFWRDLELSWWWYRAPIETQAMMIEAFGEVANDPQAVEDCKVWLLKQKQTQDWKTTKATADAVYALLLRGENLLASDALVTVALGGETIRPENVEAGTGFYEQKFVRGEITPALGAITVRKVDDGVSWGSVHWQYLEDVAQITPHEGTPLRLKKTLFVKETSARGPVLHPVTGALSVGDELVVRLELRTDRDMEYVHLKDQRGSGTEPVNVLSRYKFQDGLAYYESTRDAASHFFIDYLPKGVYVFEYSTRVQLRGEYQTGIAEIQCMYAPEFTSHSGSFTLQVR